MTRKRKRKRTTHGRVKCSLFFSFCVCKSCFLWLKRLLPVCVCLLPIWCPGVWTARDLQMAVVGAVPVLVMILRWPHHCCPLDPLDALLHALTTGAGKFGQLLWEETPSLSYDQVLTCCCVASAVFPFQVLCVSVFTTSLIHHLQLQTSTPPLTENAAASDSLSHSSSHSPAKITPVKYVLVSPFCFPSSVATSLLCLLDTLTRDCLQQLSVCACGHALSSLHTG